MSENIERKDVSVKGKESTKKHNRAARNAELFKSGDYDTLYIENEAFILYLVGKYLSTGLEFDELMSLGGLAFTKATKTFNVEKANFATYLSVLFRNEVLMELRKVKGKLHTDALHLDEPLGYSETGDELNLMSLLHDDVIIEDNLVGEDLRNCLMSCIEKLNYKSRYCILRYAFYYETHVQIAESLDISQSYVTRILDKARNKLKIMLVDRGFLSLDDDLLVDVDMPPVVNLAVKDVESPVKFKGLKGKVLEMSKNGLEAHEIADLTGASLGTVRNYRSGFVKNGFLVKLQRSAYGLATKGVYASNYAVKDAVGSQDVKEVEPTNSSNLINAVVDDCIQESCTTTVSKAVKDNGSNLIDNTKCLKITELSGSIARYSSLEGNKVRISLSDGHIDIPAGSVDVFFDELRAACSLLFD